VAAAAWWRQPAWQWRRQLGRNTISAAAAAHLEVQWQHGGNGGVNVALAAAVWRMLMMISMVTMTMMIDC
jgi:hypothetical protein